MTSHITITKPEVPLISIITISLNAGRDLEKTLTCTIKQDFHNFEYIIIDGGSTDNTIDIIKKYEHHLKFWSSEKDNGIAEAFNKGLNHCQGEWIGIINAGDWYEQGTFTEIAKNRNKAEILYGFMQYWEGDNKKEIFHANHNGLHLEMTLNHAACFVKKSVYEKIGKFNVHYKYAMDFDFLRRCHLQQIPFFKIDRELAHMHYGGISDNFLATYKEVRNIKINQGHSQLKAHTYYIYQILRKSIKNLLLYCGFHKMVDLYREKYSIISKINVTVQRK